MSRQFLKMKYKKCLYILIFYPLVPKIEICLQYFLDKNPTNRSRCMHNIQFNCSHLTNFFPLILGKSTIWFAKQISTTIPMSKNSVSISALIWWKFVGVSYPHPKFNMEVSFLFRIFFLTMSSSRGPCNYFSRGGRGLIDTATTIWLKLKWSLTISSGSKSFDLSTILNGSENYNDWISDCMNLKSSLLNQYFTSKLS